MSQEHASHDNVFFLDPRTITVQDFEAEGYLLDVGGGGEGVIGQLKGEQVIAIDRRKSELEEAPPGGLKIVMDATDLQFLDQTFSTATAFFTLMYIRERAVCARVFAEVFRVLLPGGQFLIWDGVIPTRLETDQEIVAFSLTVRLPDREIKTGYGTRWPDEEKNLAYYLDIATAAGFEVVRQEIQDTLFYVELRKSQ